METCIVRAVLPTPPSPRTTTPKLVFYRRLKGRRLTEPVERHSCSHVFLLGGRCRVSWRNTNTRTGGNTDRGIKYDKSCATGIRSTNINLQLGFAIYTFAVARLSNKSVCSRFSGRTPALPRITSNQTSISSFLHSVISSTCSCPPE